ncbi:MAG: hypothetical protein U0Z44_12645 [Kouleothrix sp.]
MNDNDTTSSRKLDHVRIVLDEDVAAKGVHTGFAAYQLPHDAVPRSGRDRHAYHVSGQPLRARC